MLNQSVNPFAPGGLPFITFEQRSKNLNTAKPNDNQNINFAKQQLLVEQIDIFRSLLTQFIGDVPQSEICKLPMQPDQLPFGYGSLIDSHAELRSLHQIKLGRYNFIKRGSILDARSHCRELGILTGPEVYFKENCYVDSYGGFIEIDGPSAFSQGVVIHGNGGVKIGKFCMAGHGAMVLAGNHRYSLNKQLPFILQGSETKGISIGENVWIGARCIILDGATIGNNVVVGAGSIIKGNIPSNHLVTTGREQIIYHIAK